MKPTLSKQRNRNPTAQKRPLGGLPRVSVPELVMGDRLLTRVPAVDISSSANPRARTNLSCLHLGRRRLPTELSSDGRRSESTEPGSGAAKLRQLGRKGRTRNARAKALARRVQGGARATERCRRRCDREPKPDAGSSYPADSTDLYYWRWPTS